MRRCAVLLLLCLLTPLMLAGCGGGGGGTPATLKTVSCGTQLLPSDYAIYAAYLNSSGQVAATIESTSAQVIITPGGSTTTLASAGPEYVFLEGMNDSGQVIGNATHGAYLWGTDGTATKLSSVGSEDPDLCKATAINSLGQICGAASYEGASRAAWWDQAGQAHILPLPAGYSSGAAMDMNDAGCIVGNVFTPNEASPVGDSHIAIWNTSGTVKVLGLHYGESLCINNAGEIVGRTATGYVGWDTSGHVKRKLKWSDAGTVMVSDINDNGQVLGGAVVGEDLIPVLWDRSGQPARLPIPDGYRVMATASINNAGQMTGWCRPVGAYLPHSMIVWTLE